MVNIINHIFLNKKQKAQVGAPFEILIAVILMGFVILAGTFAMQNLSENVCLGNKRSDFSEFRSALREVVLGSDLTYRTINLKSSACYNSSFEEVTLRTYDSKTRCSAYCNTIGSTCLLLEYAYNDEANHDYRRPIPPLCMDLPTSVNFAESLDECGVDGEDQDEWEIVNPNDPTHNIVNGTYKLYKVNLGERFPKICMIKKK